MARSDTLALYAFDRDMARSCNGIVAGVDEAGRGPLAGPVVAAAVVLDLDAPIDGVNDSKLLSAKRRDALYDLITSGAIAWAVGQATVKEIDSCNILRASLCAMQRALDGLFAAWTCALVDGNVMVPTLPKNRQKTIVRGDGTSASVAAASIVAKVTRDRIMAGYHDLYPEYGFGVHKGYGTQHHRDMLQKIGPCRIHRKSFCTNILSNTVPAFADQPVGKGGG